MKAIAAIALLTLGLANNAASAQTAPPALELRGVRAGATVTENQLSLWSCRLPDADGARTCMPGEIALGALTLKPMYLVFEGKLVSASYEFPTEKFSLAQDVFASLWAAPTSQRTTKVTTKVGVVYDNLQMTWKRTGVTADLKQFGDDINTATLSVRHEDGLIAWADRRRAREVRAAVQAAAAPPAATKGFKWRGVALGDSLPIGFDMTWQCKPAKPPIEQDCSMTSTLPTTQEVTYSMLMRAGRFCAFTVGHQGAPTLDVLTLLTRQFGEPSAKTIRSESSVEYAWEFREGVFKYVLMSASGGAIGAGAIAVGACAGPR